MLTKDELEQLRSIIQEENKPIKQYLEKIEEMLDQSIKDNAQFFNDGGIFFDEMRESITKRIDDHEKRITQLEAGAEIPRSH